MSGPAAADASTQAVIAADVIVVAAGRSTRMGGVDKLFAPIGDQPLLGWTLARFADAPGVERIVVVTSPDRVSEVRDATWLPPSVYAVVAGAGRRQTSVAAGFAALPPADDDRVVLVHDGARPLVSSVLIASVAAAVARHGAAIPAIPVVETVKRVDGDRIAGTVDRSDLATAQTPQGARRGTFLAAYARFPPDGPETWTDEAALLEACRIAVHVVPGDPSNLKVTLPSDLRQVAFALGGVSAARTGIGVDAHPFGAGEPLRLGGVSIDGAPSLHGHSDGDVALHALCDALLGAAGLGDLGRLFPAGPETDEGIDSRRMLEDVMRRVAAAGWGIANVDLTITAARPRLAAHLDPMRTAIAEALGVDPGAVNVKASTGNLLGDEGAGRSISAIAIATLSRPG